MTRLTQRGAPRNAEIEARRQKAFQLRRGGASYREIAEALQVSHQTAANDVAAILKQVNARTQDVALEYRTMQLARLDAMLMGVWGKASKGELGAVSMVIKIEERRARLLGLDAPARQEISGPEGGPIEIAPVDYRQSLARLAPSEDDGDRE